jgi:hypothetical protein
MNMNHNVNDNYNDDDNNNKTTTERKCANKLQSIFKSTIKGKGSNNTPFG